MPNDNPLPAFPLLCAHRGLSLACPENTLPAFAAAAAEGAHEIELDLWLSRDGVAVVCHDPMVERTTGGSGSGKVTDMTWDDIRLLDAGSTRGAAWRGVGIPRFEQVLETVPAGVGLNIHIKSPGPEGRLVTAVCDALRHYGRTTEGYIATNSETALDLVRDYAPEVATACLIRPPVADQIETALKHGCQRVQFNRHVSDKTIGRARDAGLIGTLYYADTPDEALEFARRGIDVILTNCAHQLIAAGIPGRDRQT